MFATETGKMQRVTRHPKHPFQLRTRPFVVQPFCIAPVLPGETLKSFTVQLRTMTDVIKNPVVGWWNEVWFFYVKHRDFPEWARQDMINMLVDPEHTLTNLDTATHVDFYHENGTDVAPDFVELCMESVMAHYFTMGAEAISTLTSVTTATVYAAGVKGTMFIDSLVNDADYITPATEDLTAVGSEAGAAVTTAEIDNAMLRYRLETFQGLTKLSYDDWCALYYGGTVAKPELHMPELLGYSGDWSYPTRAVDPTDGSVASAVNWTMAEKFSESKFFREPGFIFGVQCIRPKVYMENLSDAAVNSMNTAARWLPPYLAGNGVTSSMVKKVAGDPPVTANTDAYWFDLRDLFMHGDQYLNFVRTAADANIVVLPAAGGTKRYVPTADIDLMFTAASPANQCYTDGLVSLHIAGRLDDRTTSTFGGTLADLDT